VCCANECRYTVATTTVWSGLSYVFSKDAVRILKHPTTPTEAKGGRGEDGGGGANS
jgi:cardiolipin synthase